MAIERIHELPDPPQRRSDAHKGSFGRVLIIAGSRGMSGAACLSGLGALRGGAGLVFVAAPAEIVPIIAAAEPSYLTLPLPEDEEGRLNIDAMDVLGDEISTPDAIAIGPGLGQSAALTDIVCWLYRDLDQPLVVDADALNALSTCDFWPEPEGPRILTPHPGEFARLTGKPIADIQAAREESAVEFAAQLNCILVLKGAGTIITDGRRLAVNETGNSGMATGGSGDVLTGLITALLAQGLPPFEAAQLAAHVHGRAGDLAAAELSQPGLIASDLPHYLARVWQTL